MGLAFGCYKGANRVKHSPLTLPQSSLVLRKQLKRLGFHHIFALALRLPFRHPRMIIVYKKLSIILIHTLLYYKNHILQ